MTLVHFDFESFLIYPALQAPPIVCMQYAVDRADPEIVPAWEDQFDDLWQGWLQDPTVYFSAYNGRFDFACLCARNPSLYLPLVFNAYKAKRITDTMIRETLLRLAKGDGRDVRNLGDTLEEHGIKGVDKTDPWRRRYGELWLKPVETWDGGAIHYALEDARAERDLFWSQQARFDAMGYACPDQFAQSFSGFWLYLMQCWGARTNLAAATKYADEVRATLEAERAQLLAAGLIDAKGKKETKIAKALLVAAFAAQGRPHPKTPTGEPQLNDEACAQSGNPLLQAYTRYTQAGTLLGKVELLKKPIIQPSYNPLVATGRTSCRQGKPPKPGQAPSQWGAQMQNPPVMAGIRECYVAEPDHAIVSIDFETFELRTLAQTCWWRFRFSNLREILNDRKRDAHVEMGARLTDRTVDEAYALKVLDKVAFKAMRDVAKGPNFGLPGYMGWERLIGYCYDNYGVVVSPELAQKAVRVWKEVFPEMILHLRSARDKCVKVIGHKKDTKEPILGGDFMAWTSGRLRGNIPITELSNSEFQPLASDAAKFSGGRLAEACYVPRVNPIVYGCRPFGFVHDEFLFFVPLEGLHEKAYELCRIQKEAAQEWIPDVEVRAEPGAMLAWSKKAGDPVFNSAGKLIPFEWREAA